MVEYDLREGSGFIDITNANLLFNSVGWKDRTHSQWEGVLSKSSYFISAHVDERIIGMGRILEDGVMCMFYDVCVHPDFQRDGIGNAMLQKMIDQVKDKKYVSIGLFAWDGNPGNSAFYEQLGFKESHGMELFKYMTPD